MTQREDEAVRSLAEALKSAKLRFVREPSLGGVRPDLLVFGPEGQSVVIKVKDWDPRGGNTAKAAEQAGYFQEATGSNHALFVLPDLEMNYHNLVVGAGRVLPTLEKLFELSPTPSPGEPALRESASEGLVIAAMPFARKYNDTYRMMIDACDAAKVTCERVDQVVFNEDIVQEIKKLIRKSVAVIVDLSQAKPNVLYEAGFAHALRKPCIHITSTPKTIPFNVSTWQWIEYELGDAGAILDDLTKHLNEALRR